MGAQFYLGWRGLKLKLNMVFEDIDARTDALFCWVYWPWTLLWKWEVEMEMEMGMEMEMEMLTAVLTLRTAVSRRTLPEVRYLEVGTPYYTLPYLVSYLLTVGRVP